jgi:hypothetical protein
VSSAAAPARHEIVVVGNEIAEEEKEENVGDVAGEEKLRIAVSVRVTGM